MNTHIVNAAPSGVSLCCIVGVQSSNYLCAPPPSFQKDTAATNDPFAPGGTAVNVSSDPGMSCCGGAPLWPPLQLQPLLGRHDSRGVLTVSVDQLYECFRVFSQIRLPLCSAVSRSEEALLISVPWRRYRVQFLRVFFWVFFLCAGRKKLHSFQTVLIQKYLFVCLFVS